MTTIFGRFSPVFDLADRLGAKPELRRNNDGSTHTSIVACFEGGYDDYDGIMAYAEVPADVGGPLVRFSPKPGVWMSGVHIK